jgi:hypothetical protein
MASRANARVAASDCVEKPGQRIRARAVEASNAAFEACLKDFSSVVGRGRVVHHDRMRSVALRRTRPRKER